MRTRIRRDNRREPEPGRAWLAWIFRCPRGALAVVALLTVGCATERKAPGDGLSPKPFRCDGCTLFPDGVPGEPHAFRAACNRHDLAYWRGGTWAERIAADRELRDEIRAQGRPLTAAAMFAGVRLGGLPFLPTSWRWGFAWPYGRFYRPLTDEEAAQLARSLEEHPPGKGSVITY